MAWSDFLWQGAPPPSVTTNAVGSQYLPDWYQDYTRGIAGKATAVATSMENSPVPAASVAGFSGDQTSGFGRIRSNVGSWQPHLAQAGAATEGLVPTANRAAGVAQGAVAGPAGQWTQQWSQYMSPYTQGVVDNIARLGVRNWNEQILPGINDQFIGNGQFGSTRNADVVARAGRDVSADILGQQSGALQQGYFGSADIMANDANRQQQQQQLQANTALAGGGMQVGALGQAAGLFSGLGQQKSALGFADGQSLVGIGQQQQAQQQKTLDTSFENNMRRYTQPWEILNNLNSITRGMQLPSTTMGSTNQPLPGAGYAPGAFGALSNVYGAVTAGR